VRHQAKKRFGQNFIRDKNLLKKIVRDSDIDNKHVIEVGPGQGALTSFLATCAKSVIAYEIDKSLKPILDEIEEKHSNLVVLYKDFLDVDLSKLEKDYHVVANVPYYITTPILFKLLECKQIKTASLMIQKEVCLRLTATPNTKQYNALSVIIQYQAQVFKMLDVKRHMFHPKPNVDSAVIRIVKRDTPLLDAGKEAKFKRIVKAAFKQKRKTLVNNWYQEFGISKEKIIKFLADNGYQQNVRAEALSKEDFLILTRKWEND
jgi:16S rRNA (adenine1518-N6/adenine1519-N6)-dimethyltransferase